VEREGHLDGVPLGEVGNNRVKNPAFCLETVNNWKVRVQDMLPIELTCTDEFFDFDIDFKVDEFLDQGNILWIYQASMEGKQ
jgi:hypothetical protein